MFEFESKEKKKSSDDSFEMIGYGVIALVVVAGVIVSLPILVLSLIFALLASRFLEKKLIYFVSFLGLVASLIGFYFWSYPPLLQSLGLFKGFLPSWVKKAEEIFQNGQPFVLTYQSYLLILVVSVAFMGLWVMIGKALGKNWFTKEKEQEKDDYLASDTFKKIDKKSVKYTDKIQQTYRKSKGHEVLLGMDIKKQPVVFNILDLFKHCLVSGTTGSGKTVMMYNIMEQALREDMGVIYVDGKGSPKTVQSITKLANHYGKKVYNFSDKTDWHYNPVKYGKPTSITDRLIDSMEWSEPYYKGESKNLLQKVIRFLHDFGFPSDLETIYEHLNVQTIGEFLYQQQEVTEEKAKTNLDTSKLTIQADKKVQLYNKLFFGKPFIEQEDIEKLATQKDEQMKLIKGLRTQLEMLLYSDLGEKFQEVEGKTLDIKEIITNGDIVVFSLDSNNYSSFIGLVGRFIIADCCYITQELFNDLGDFKGVLGMFDEFGAYGTDNILQILSQAREANFGAVLGIQSYSDLANKRRNIDIKQQTVDNCNTFIIGRANDSDNAEEIAKLIGTYRDIDRTVMTENKGSRLMRIETKGERGTVRKVNKFIFDPDRIKDLPSYQFFYVNKNQREDNKKEVYSRNVFSGLAD